MNAARAQLQELMRSCREDAHELGYADLVALEAVMSAASSQEEKPIHVWKDGYDVGRKGGLNAPTLNKYTADLVLRFSDALRQKLAAAEKKYGYSDGWMDPSWMDKCRAELLEHVAKGDPRDVAAYCAFLWHHGERTSSAANHATSPAAEAVLEAAREWSSERTIKDWAEADLMKAVSTLDGDWPGCEECDHQCDEPCMPATVAQQHACVDRQIAQLIHEGKLFAHEGHTPPEGFQPYPPRRKNSPIAGAAPHHPV